MTRFAWAGSGPRPWWALAAWSSSPVVLAVTGPHLAHLYGASVANCSAHSDCATAAAAFAQTDKSLRNWLGALVIVVPALIGIFWGAPLVAAELEAGTHRLVCRQSVTRTRWLGVKLGVVGLASMAIAGLLSLIVTWWASPVDRASMNAFGTFDQRDIVPVGYAAFAFALGVSAEALARRVTPAIATTLVSFTVARVAFSQLVRPQLIGPVLRHLALNPATTGYGSSGLLLLGAGPATLEPSAPDIPNAWVISTRIVDKAGRALRAKVLKSNCPLLGRAGPGTAGGHSNGPAPAGAVQVLRDCVDKLGATYHELVAYQPASRYWALQWYELAIYLAVTVILGASCIWWIRRRLV